MTVIAANAVTPEIVALTLVEPGATPVTVPKALIVATEEFEDSH